MSDLATLREVRRLARETLGRRIRVWWIDTQRQWDGSWTAGLASYRERDGKFKFTDLQFSRTLWPHMDVAGRREIILHEVAHALLPLDEDNESHGPVWQATHITLGGSGIDRPSDLIDPLVLMRL